MRIHAELALGKTERHFFNERAAVDKSKSYTAMLYCVCAGEKEILGRVASRSGLFSCPESMDPSLQSDPRTGNRAPSQA